MRTLRGAVVGAGYFSRFHLDAWSRIPGVEIAVVCDRDLERARRAAAEFGIPGAVSDPDAALGLDFVDLATPPDSRLDLVTRAAARGTAVLSQKPLAPDLATARALADVARRAGLRVMVHENFRFQPWYREIRRLLDAGRPGGRVQTLSVRTRTGDGWRPDAYLERQPYFREMPRLLVFETGVHFVDVFRYLAGEIEEVYAILRRLNPAIRGEDSGLVTFRFAGGGLGIWDAGRYHESEASDPRYTFGEALVETQGGAIRLDGEGRLTIKPLGEAAREHPYAHGRRGFAGDCVHATLSHFVDRLRDGGPFETGLEDSLRTFEIQDAVYRSAAEGRPVKTGREASSRKP